MDNQNTQNTTEEYTMPTERLSGMELPKNPNTWLFVMVVFGISSIFSILMVLQNNRLEDTKEDRDQWKKMYFAEKKDADSLRTARANTENAVDQVYRLKQALYKVDSITATPNPREKISKKKLNDEIKTALSD